MQRMLKLLNKITSKTFLTLFDKMVVIVQWGLLESKSWSKWNKLDQFQIICKSSLYKYTIVNTDLLYGHFELDADVEYWQIKF